jgi:hypothetical protein
MAKTEEDQTERVTHWELAVRFLDIALEWCKVISAAAQLSFVLPFDGKQLTRTSAIRGDILISCNEADKVS